MPGWNPWVVLSVAEDASYHEIQSAFRRRAKQTHPDHGGDATEFATVVQAFDAVRRTGAPTCPRRPTGPTPYDTWLRPCRAGRTWADEGSRESVGPRRSAPTWAASTTAGVDHVFSDLLRGEMSKVGATAAVA